MSLPLGDDNLGENSCQRKAQLEEDRLILAPYSFASPKLPVSADNSTPNGQPSISPRLQSKTKLSKDGTRVILRRKGKPHVSSACLHCRRSHLACDRNRPCNRCISSGKADDCYDTQHKKRGRPKSSSNSNSAPSGSTQTTSTTTTNKDGNNSTDSSRYFGLGCAVGNAALASVYPNSVRSDSGDASTTTSRLSRKKGPHLSPVLPLFEPKFDLRSLLDQLHPKLDTSSPSAMASGSNFSGSNTSNSLELTLNEQGSVLETCGSDSFLDMDQEKMVHVPLINWIHYDDRLKFTRALSKLTLENKGDSHDAISPLSVRVHIQNSRNDYELVDLELMKDEEEPGTIKCNVTKFDLSALLRQAPPGNLSLFE